MALPPIGPNQKHACNINEGDRVVIDGTVRTVTEFIGAAPMTGLRFDDRSLWCGDMFDPIDIPTEA
jgi:hypothetical protein